MLPHWLLGARCPICGSDRVKSRVLRKPDWIRTAIRSLMRQPQTVIYTCKQCGNEWTVCV